MTKALTPVCAVLAALASASAGGHRSTPQRTAVLPGIEVFLSDVPAALRGKRVGLITNHSATDRATISDIDLIAANKSLRLVALLAPEHGIRGNAEAGQKILDEVDA